MPRSRSPGRHRGSTGNVVNSRGNFKHTANAPPNCASQMIHFAANKLNCANVDTGQPFAQMVNTG